MEYKYKITVFTPTYNRAYIIETLHRSLQRQCCTDFEWVVVDDGSSDGTEELFARWAREENPFPIRYHKQENGGKCRAINRGLEMAEGELFFTVDSDDYLTDNALEKVIQWDAELPRDQKYCGFAGNRGTTPDFTPNRLFEGGYLDGTALDRYGSKQELYGKVDGERAYVFYTDIHRQYMYPEFPGEKFLTEAVTWDRMAWDGYKMRYVNPVTGGYPMGTGLFFRQKAKFLNYSLKDILGMWYGFTCDAMERCSDAQIAEYIDMPRWLVKPMKWIHALVQVIRKKR